MALNLREKAEDEMPDELRVFKIRQQRLIELIDRFQAVAAALEDTTLADWMRQLGERVAQDSFKVLVLGPYDVGKTTLINAHLGQKVLPAYMSPATAVPTEVKYDDRPHAVLYPRDGNTPSEVPVEQLRDHVVVAADQQNQYRKVELYYPLELCQNGVVIVDSPGLDDNYARDQITRNYLRQADAIVFISMAMGAFRDTEKKFLERYVLTLGHTDSGFYLFNWFNHVEESERPDVIASAKRRLAEVGVNRDDRVFFINAKGALDGRVSGDSIAVETSAVPEFEHALRRFLAEDRGRVKLLAAAREISQRLVKSRGVIQDRQRMCDHELAALVNNYKAEQPKLEELERRRESIIAGLDNDIQNIMADADQEVRRFLSAFAAKCPQWATEAPTQTRLPARPTNEQVEAFAHEVVAFLEETCLKLEGEWRVQYLRPLLAERLVALEKNLRPVIENFVLQARNVQHTIAGTGVATDDLQATVGRALANTEELRVSTGLDASGATITFGGTEALKLLIDASFLIPHMHYFLRFIAGLLAKGALNEVKHTRVKQQIGEAIRRDLEQNMTTRADEYTRQLALELKQLPDDQDRLLRAETETVREQVQAAIRDKQEGENKVARRLAELRQLRKETDLIGSACDDLIGEI